MAGWKATLVLLLVCLTACTLLHKCEGHVPVGRSLAEKRFKFPRNQDKYDSVGASWGQQKRMFDANEFARKRSYDDSPYDTGKVYEF